MNIFSRKKKDLVMDRLNIKEISEDLVIAKDASVSAIIKVKPFDVGMPAHKRSKKIAQFRKFLSELDMPVQISTRTVNSQIKDQLMIMKAEIDHKIKNDENKMHMLEDFQELFDWLSSYGEKKCKPERLFYIIVKTVPNEDSPKKAAKNQAVYKELTQDKAELLLEKASKFVSARRLIDLELKNMFHSYYYFTVYDNKSGQFLDMQHLIGLRGIKNDI